MSNQQLNCGPINGALGELLKGGETDMKRARGLKAKPKPRVKLVIRLAWDRSPAYRTIVATECADTLLSRPRAMLSFRPHPHWH